MFADNVQKLTTTKSQFELIELISLKKKLALMTTGSGHFQDKS